MSFLKYLQEIYNNRPSTNKYNTTINFNGNDIDVTVFYSIAGHFIKGDIENPPEYPELDIINITVDETKEDITNKISKELEEQIEKEIWLYEEQ